MSGEIIGAVFGGVVASLLTLFGVLATSRWRRAEDNVIKQRAEWRDAVRSLIAQAVIVSDEDTARRVWAELALRMNPDLDIGKDDRELVELIRSLIVPANRNDAVRGRIVELAAHILKHDWTRAKWEAQGWFWEDEPEQTQLDGRTRFPPPVIRQRPQPQRTGMLFPRH